jgi:hypothetical protein
MFTGVLEPQGAETNFTPIVRLRTVCNYEHFGRF